MMPPRARFFDHQVLAALDAGISQIVIAGAGYDDRALRFRKTGAKYFELDLPHVTADKAERYSAMSADLSQVTLLATYLPRKMLRPRSKDLAMIISGRLCSYASMCSSGFPSRTLSDSWPP